jgi:hypothetical protein
MMSPREMEKRLDHMERLIREMHAKIMTGEAMELQPGSEEVKRAAREMLNGNMALVNALGGRKVQRRGMNGRN